MWFPMYDIWYLIFLAPGMLLAAWAQWRVQSAFAAASEIPASSGVVGAQAADIVLRTAGVEGVRIEETEGFLSDHYVPGEKVLRLSPPVYEGCSLASLGVAAHEAGHGIQDDRRYSLLVLRNGLVPLAMIGSNLSWIIIIAGFLLQMTGLILVGIVAFSMVVVFQLVNLPVELDASRRARVMLLESGLVTQTEDETVKKVLDAAALTYVAATLTSVLTLLYFLFRAGLLGGRSRND